MTTKQPIPINTVSGLEPEYILDGIQAVGTSLNIVSLKYKGNTNLQIDELISVQTPSKLKGILEVKDFKQILTLKLCDIGPVIIKLLLCTQLHRKFQGKFLFQIRQTVVKALRRSIEKLPETSTTKKDSAFRIGDDFAINNQEDWEQVGHHFSAEISDAYRYFIESDKFYVELCEFWKEMECSKDIKNSETVTDGEMVTDGRNKGCVYFTAEKIGQENVLNMWGRMFREDEMDLRFNCLRVENIMRLIIHWASDYKPDNNLSSKYLLVSNSEYISSRLPQDACDYYCPFLCIPGFGNLRYTFKKQQNTKQLENNIFGCQVYLRWTNYMKNQKKHEFFRKLFISDRLCQLARNRFDFFMKDGKESFTRVYFEQDKRILRYEHIQLIRGILDILEAGVEVRVEVVHSAAFSPNSEKRIGSIMSNAFKEVRSWLEQNELSSWNQEHMFSYMEKKLVMDWANYHILPAINTIEKMTKKTSQILSAKTVMDIPHTSFWSAEDYYDAKAAEVLVCFFLNGRLVEKNEKANPKKSVIFYGLDAKNRQGSFLLKNIKFENGFLRSSNSETLFEIPKWISWPELLFLQEIRSAVEMITQTGNFSGKLLPRALLGYAISFEEDAKKKNSNIIYNKYPGSDEIDDGLDFRTMIFESNKFQNNLDPNSICKKTVKTLSDMVNNLKEASAIGKPVVSYVLNMVERRLEIINPSWNINYPIIEYLEEKYFRFKVDVPIVFSLTGGHYLAGIPYGFPSYPMDQYSPLLKNTYLWYKGNTPSYKLNAAEEFYFAKFHSFFTIFSINLRSKVEINELIKLLFLVTQAKSNEDEVRRIVSKIEIDCANEKWNLANVYKFLEKPTPPS